MACRRIRGYYFKALISETKSSGQRRSFRDQPLHSSLIKERFAVHDRAHFATGLVLLGVIIWLFARHAGPTLNARAPSRAFRQDLTTLN